jgi:hypothetical protein
MLDVMTTHNIHKLGKTPFWMFVCPYPTVYPLPLSRATNSAPAHPGCWSHALFSAVMPLKWVPRLGRTHARFLHAGLVIGIANIVRVFAHRWAIVPPVRATTRREPGRPHAGPPGNVLRACSLWEYTS